MPCYDYCCASCEIVEEIIHSIKKNPKIICKKCSSKMERMIGLGTYIVSKGIKQSLDNQKESEHKKKVKDPERALKSRKKMFGVENVGNPKMESDPKHLIKGRALGGQQKTVDRDELTVALSKDNYAVHVAQEALKKSKS